MRILHLSDTHGAHKQLTDWPEADVVVHSGDFTMAGAIDEVVDFINWFCDLPYRHKIFLPGNHDDCLLDAKVDGLPDNCHFLYNSGVEIDGVRFYGLPMFVAWSVTDEQERFTAAIPEGTDVLITHQPPYGILDYSGGIHWGSEILRQRVQTIRPRLHLFGHVHDAYGLQPSSHTRYSNAALMDEQYRLVHSPRIINCC